MKKINQNIAEIVKNYRTIAVVGLSPNPMRPSFGIAAKMQQSGYRVIPVNPNYESVLGEKCYPSLTAVPEPVELVVVFRRAEETPAIAREAVAIGAKGLWLQSGIINEEAAEIALQGGLDVVMDHCWGVAYSLLN